METPEIIFLYRSYSQTSAANWPEIAEAPFSLESVLRAPNPIDFLKSCC